MRQTALSSSLNLNPCCRLPSCFFQRRMEIPWPPATQIISMSIRDISRVISYNGSIWSGKESNGGFGKWIHEVAKRPITRLKSSWLERALADCKVRKYVHNRYSRRKSSGLAMFLETLENYRLIIISQRKKLQSMNFSSRRYNFLIDTEVVASNHATAQRSGCGTIELRCHTF